MTCDDHERNSSLAIWLPDGISVAFFRVVVLEILGMRKIFDRSQVEEVEKYKLSLFKKKGQSRGGKIVGHGG